MTGTREITGKNAVIAYLYPTAADSISHPGYSAPFELFYWDNSAWVSVGTHDVYGHATEIRFATPINTTKLRFELAQAYSGEAYAIKEILVF